MANLPYGISGPSTTVLAKYQTTPPVLPTDSTYPFQCDINGNLKVAIVSGSGTGGTISVDLPNRGAITPSGGTITTANTSQQILAANASRKYLFVQNHSSEKLWINFGAAATQNQPSIELAPNGGAYENGPTFCSNQAINIIGATAGSTFTVQEA